MVRAAADDVQLALERVVVGDVRPAADEQLLDHRLRSLRGRPDHAVVVRHLAPAEERLSLVRDHLLEQVLAGGAASRVVGQEHHADAVLAGGRQVDAERRARRRQEAMRHLHQDAGAVAGVLFTPAGAPVLEVQQDFERVLDDARRLAPLQIDDETDAAGVVLVPGIVEALRGGRSCQFHR
jgi:hypothetical protein